MPHEQFRIFHYWKLNNLPLNNVNNGKDDGKFYFFQENYLALAIAVNWLGHYYFVSWKINGNGNGN